MTTFIVAATTIVGALGICVVAWSIIDTRKKYFYDYLARKRKND